MTQNVSCEVESIILLFSIIIIFYFTEKKVRKNASATFRGGGVEGRGGLTSLTQEELLKPEKGQQP